MFARLKSRFSVQLARIFVWFGARKMDSKRGGRQWRSRIDVGRIDLYSSRNCVAAQVYGNFYDAPASIRFHPAYGYGVLYGTEHLLTIPALTAAWRKELARK